MPSIAAETEAKAASSRSTPYELPPKYIVIVKDLKLVGLEPVYCRHLRMGGAALSLLTNDCQQLIMKEAKAFPTTEPVSFLR